VIEEEFMDNTDEELLVMALHIVLAGPIISQEGDVSSIILLMERGKT
jgi:hypothetical protein